MKYFHTISLQGSVEQMRKRIAYEQAAMHQVQLGVARWSSNIYGNHIDHENAPPVAASRREWHAAAQCHFVCWLADGGFAQACEESAATQPAIPACTLTLPGTEADDAHLPAARHNCTA